MCATVAGGLLKMAHIELMRACLFAVMFMGVDATDPVVQVQADAVGTCYYELKIPKASCQPCKVKSVRLICLFICLFDGNTFS